MWSSTSIKSTSNQASVRSASHDQWWFVTRSAMSNRTKLGCLSCGGGSGMAGQRHRKDCRDPNAWQCTGWKFNSKRFGPNSTASTASTASSASSELSASNSALWATAADAPGAGARTATTAAVGTAVGTVGTVGTGWKSFGRRSCTVGRRFDDEAGCCRGSVDQGQRSSFHRSHRVGPRDGRDGHHWSCWCCAEGGSTAAAATGRDSTAAASTLSGLWSFAGFSPGGWEWRCHRKHGSRACKHDVSGKSIAGHTEWVRESNRITRQKRALLFAPKFLTHYLHHYLLVWARRYWH